MQVRTLSFGLMAGLATVLSMAAFNTTMAAEPGQAVVSYGDLDTSRAAGVAVLYQRIQVAAQKVCASLDGKELPRHAIYKRCKLSAIDKAIADVAVPALTEYHVAHSGAARVGERIAVR